MNFNTLNILLLKRFIRVLHNHLVRNIHQMRITSNSSLMSKMEII